MEIGIDFGVLRLVAAFIFSNDARENKGGDKSPHSKKNYKGWLIPPSFRTRQKWMAINPATTSGMATQCKM